MDVQPGTVLGERFEVVGVLGHGGMATVYLVNDRLRGDAVALKVLHGHLARSAAMRSRLRREVMAASRLRHPSALVAWDLHELDGQLAVSMPLHRGGTLEEYVERHGPMTGPALERLAVQLGSVLREAHAGGIVHRDVTPCNVMIDEAGEAVLTDFGLARFTDQRTATGTGVLGTAGYAAPEIFQGVRSDPRSDLYSLGAVLYHAATGVSPFHASDPVGSLRRQLDDDRTPLGQARPDLPAHLVGTIESLLAIDPEARPQGAAEMLEAFRGQRAPPPPVRAPGEEPRHHLPPGSWTVVVREASADRDRRRRMRHKLRRVRHHPLESDIARIVEEVKRWVMEAVGVRGSRSPEERLVTAVGRAAGLPDGALAMPPALLERRFRLVERTSPEVARRLAKAAQSEGFDAKLADVDAPPEPDPMEPWRSAIGVVAIAILGAALGLALLVPLLIEILASAGLIGSGVELGMPPWILFFVFFPLLFMGRRRSRRNRDLESLPVAFGTDLRLHLATEAGVALPPPLEEAPPEPSRTVPEVARAPADRHAALLRRTRTQLDDLDRALAEAERDLPRTAVRDLRATLRDLREKSEHLGRLAVGMERELARLDESGAASAVDRVQGRLDRLRTLARAGGADAGIEIAELERAVAAHRDTLAQSEQLEGRLTVVMARLLEIGAAAARARVDLLGREPARSVADLLERLRGETGDAAAALAEVEGRAQPRLRREPVDHDPRGERAQHKPASREEG